LILSNLLAVTLVAPIATGHWWGVRCVCYF